MIFLYTALLLIVGVAHFLFKRRVSALEKKYSGVVKEAEDLIRQSGSREGNSRHDPYQNAKRQFKLAMLADKRDKMEAKYLTWHGRAERLSKLRQRLRAWKGRKLPYTFGVLDVTGALALIDYLGAGHYLNARHLVEMVTSLFAR
jgi:predicted aminopeptidase